MDKKIVRAKDYDTVHPDGLDVKFDKWRKTKKGAWMCDVFVTYRGATWIGTEPVYEFEKEVRNGVSPKGNEWEKTIWHRRLVGEKPVTTPFRLIVDEKNLTRPTIYAPSYKSRDRWMNVRDEEVALIQAHITYLFLDLMFQKGKINKEDLLGQKDSAENCSNCIRCIRPSDEDIFIDYYGCRLGMRDEFCPIEEIDDDELTRHDLIQLGRTYYSTGSVFEKELPPNYDTIPSWFSDMELLNHMLGILEYGYKTLGVKFKRPLTPSAEYFIDSETDEIDVEKVHSFVYQRCCPPKLSAKLLLNTGAITKAEYKEYESLINRFMDAIPPEKAEVMRSAGRDAIENLVIGLDGESCIYGTWIQRDGSTRKYMPFWSTIKRTVVEQSIGR